ncbi:MAG: S24 family peptidase [Candidatus Gracilibacteria bacterium]|nr:S24 family peptidase [Candidatus Gracilibacteria bacterium]
MLTDKQQNVLDIITDFIGRYAKSPTIEELQTLTHQKSKRGVVQYLEALEKRGFITRGSGFRSIRLGNGVGFQTMLNIPILGIANAGRPLALADQYEYGTLPISKTLIHGEGQDYFIVKVEGTSMNEFRVNDKYIENGSYVLIDKREKVINTNDAFLFVVDNAATLKIPKKEGNNLYLIPKSRDNYHKPIVVSEDDNVLVNGKVVDVFNFEKVS